MHGLSDDSAAFDETRKRHSKSTNNEEPKR
jgi:hypothetical protein